MLVTDDCMAGDTPPFNHGDWHGRGYPTMAGDTPPFNPMAIEYEGLPSEGTTIQVSTRWCFSFHQLHSTEIMLHTLISRSCSKTSNQADAKQMHPKLIPVWALDEFIFVWSQTLRSGFYQRSPTDLEAEPADMSSTKAISPQ